MGREGFFEEVLPEDVGGIAEDAEECEFEDWDGIEGECSLEICVSVVMGCGYSRFLLTLFL